MNTYACVAGFILAYLCLMFAPYIALDMLQELRKYWFPLTMSFAVFAITGVAYLGVPWYCVLALTVASAGSGWLTLNDEERLEDYPTLFTTLYIISSAILLLLILLVKAVR